MNAKAGLLTLAILAAPGSVLGQTQAVDAPSLQKQLREWFMNLLAPVVTLPEPALAVTPDGDGFRLALPLDTLTGKKKDEVVARIRPMEKGIWSLEEMRVPAEGRFEIPADVTPGGSGASTVTFTIGDQIARGTYDPSFTTRSSANVEIRDVSVRAASATETQEQTIDRYTLQASLVPGADGRIDIAQEGTVDGWDSKTRMADGSSMTFEIRRLRESGRIEGISRDRVDTIVKALKSVAAEAMALPRKEPALTDKMKAELRSLIGMFRDIAVRMEAEETMDDISIEIAGLGSVSIDQFRFGGGVEAPDSRLRAWIDLAVDGPDSDVLPKAVKKYIPSRIALRPAVSGLSVDRVFALLTDASGDNPDQKKLKSDAMALLADPNMRIGLEVLTLELDPVRIDGSGRLRMITPDKAGIEARLSASGLDDLMAEAQKVPDLAPAIPFLILARGLARPDGNRLVWDLAITEDQALVNGVDVMKMNQGGGKDGQKRPNKR